MASGDLLLELRDRTQYEKLAALASFGSFQVTVTPHRSMNTVRGVVSDDDLINLPDSELLDGWKEQNVVNVQRIKIRRDNIEKATKHIIVTFGSSELPETIETGYTKLRVRPYIPNPRRCFKCQRCGHSSHTCKGQSTCARCASQEHISDNCESEAHCVNCGGSHPAYSRSCSAWRREKDIISLKVRENISFREARKRCSPFHGTTYLDAARQGAALHQPSPSARPVRSESAVVAAPAVDVAKSMPPTPQQSPAIPGPSGVKASAHQPKPETRSDSPHVRASGASQEAMDTMPAPRVPKDRRGSLDRVRKTKKTITRPDAGSVT